MKGPVYVRLGRSKVPTIENKTLFSLGKGQVLREGNAFAIIACGIMTRAALEAGNALAQEGIQCRVINIHTIKPLDEELIRDAAQQTKGMVVCEEHSTIGGLGGAVEEVVAHHGYGIPVARVGVHNRFGQSGDSEALLREYKLQPQDIVSAVKNIARKS
jgi:transketolase